VLPHTFAEEPLSWPVNPLVFSKLPI